MDLSSAGSLICFYSQTYFVALVFRNALVIHRFTMFDESTVNNKCGKRRVAFFCHFTAKVGELVKKANIFIAKLDILNFNMAYLVYDYSL